MIPALMRHWALLEGEGAGDAPAGGATAAPQAASAPAADTGMTPPDALLGDNPAGSPKPDAELKPDDKPAEPDKPIEYTDFTVPDGLVLDAEKLGAFKAIAAESKMPQEMAQKFVDIYTAEMKTLSEAPMKAWTEMQNQWQQAIRNDPEIGGANLDKNLAATKAGLNNLLGDQAPKFFEALSITGAGNNPEIVRGLFKAAQAHAPATPVAGSPNAASSKSAGATLYPKMAGLGNGHES